MSDLVCGICGDLTSADHVNFGYPFWKRELFVAGHGCENCEGSRPENQDPDQLADALRQDQDEVDKILRIDKAFDGKDYSEDWVEPPPEVLATCSKCGDKVEVSADEVLAIHDGKTWVKGVSIERPKGSGRHTTLETVPISKLTFDEIEKEYGEEFHKIGDLIFCHDCTAVCADCDGRFNEEDTVYSQGTMETMCVDCEAKRPRCSTCDSYVVSDEDLERGLCEHCRPPKTFGDCKACGASITEEDDFHEGPHPSPLCGECLDKHDAMKKIGLPHLLMPGEPTTECGVPRDDITWLDYLESVTEGEIRCWDCHMVICNEGRKS